MSDLVDSQISIRNSRLKLQWYALRITYSRELALKEYLDANGIENFIPMHYEYSVRNERRVRKLVPVIHNLVFVHSSRNRIDQIKDTMNMMDKETRQPIIIPDSQMRSFMAIAGNYDQQLVYLEPSTVSFRKGDRVRVIGGAFAGIEGEFLRIKNDRRVVVSIEGVVAVATAFIHPSLVEPIIER